jgi:regulator of PEP synthase PpsR (kinase-PPPase family)
VLHSIRTNRLSFMGVKSGDIEYNAMRQVNQELAMAR